jgi:hypothetical protein
MSSPQAPPSIFCTACKKSKKPPMSELEAPAAPGFGWFTEGFDMRDLKGAKKLLDELHL